MYNLVMLLGRVAAAPELRRLPSGEPVARFRLAVDRPRKAAGGQQQGAADFFTIVVRGRQAEAAPGQLGKGRLVYVEGRLQIREHTGRDGKRRRAAEVLAARVVPVGLQAAAVAPAEGSAPAGDLGDVPF